MREWVHPSFPSFKCNTHLLLAVEGRSVPPRKLRLRHLQVVRRLAQPRALLLQLCPPLIQLPLQELTCVDGPGVCMSVNRVCVVCVVCVCVCECV